MCTTSPADTKSPHSGASAKEKAEPICWPRLVLAGLVFADYATSSRSLPAARLENQVVNGLRYAEPAGRAACVVMATQSKLPDELLLIFSTVNPVLPLGRMKTKRAARESRPVPSDRVHPDLHCDSCRNSDYSRRPSSLCSVISGARRLGGDVANSPPLRLHPDNSSDMPRRISQPRGC